MDIQPKKNRMLQNSEMLLAHADRYFEKDYNNVCEAITTFEHDSKTAGYSETSVDDAKFFLCALLDERCLWKISLLKTFYGAKHNKDYEFYDRLQKHRNDLYGNIDLLELAYFCLSLGFRGKYRHDPAGNGVIKMMGSLYSDIRRIRGDSNDQLSENPQKQEERYWRSPPIWITIIIALAILFSIYIPYNNKLSQYTLPVIHMLKNITNIEPNGNDSQKKIKK